MLTDLPLPFHALPQYGLSILGPAYQPTTGPRTKLSGLSRNSEPGLGLSTPITATLTISGLTANKRYALYTITSPCMSSTTCTSRRTCCALTGVPAVAGGAINAALYPPTYFVAAATTRTMSVTLQSRTPTYYICRAA